LSGRPVRRDLTALFNPASVAVVGASTDETKWGHWLAKGALRGAHRRPVALVNRRGGTILGQPAHVSLRDVRGGVELAAICVPAAAFQRAVTESLDCGARAIVGITAGLGESGAAGHRIEAAIAAEVRAAGAVLLGPNCLGLSDTATDLYLTSDELPSGPVGLISQSGNLALELGLKAASSGLGFVRFASLGNQADIDVADLISAFAGAADVSAIAVYCEDFGDGRRFLEASAAATSAGKPVVLLAAGASRAGARAARSHTGALVSGRLSVAAACLAAGIEQVDTPGQLIEALSGILLDSSAAVPAALRVGVLADGGGHGAVAADVAEAAGLIVPLFSPGLAAEVARATGTPGAASNPVDLAGAGEQDPWSFARVLQAMLASGEVDAVILTGYFGGYSYYGTVLGRAESEVADALVEVTRASGKPVVVHAMHDGTSVPEPLARLRAGRLPVSARVEGAVAILARLAARAARGGVELPEQVAPAPPHVGEGYFAARGLLAEGGIALAPAVEASDDGEAVRAARTIGYPVVVKATMLEHKSDAGGVALGLDTDEAVVAAVGSIRSRVGPGPLTVEKMITLAGGVELVVGTRRDARFGAVVLVGLGGIYTEVLRDVAAALAPVDERQARRLLSGLRGAPLLFGARGRPPLDVGAAASVVAAISRIGASHPEIAELEINPLLVGVEGAWGLDARVILGGPGTNHLGGHGRIHQ
jgi:acyl-CoA synthetase (NDP forming)